MKSRICSTCSAILPGGSASRFCPRCRTTIGLSIGEGNGDPAPPARCLMFGQYELDGEIARGGMGVVYLARDPRINRTVALKMIRSGALASDAEVERFRNEAAAAANLDHPHIVPIYEIGEADGFHFFTMKLLEGGHLGELNAACAARDVAWHKRAARIVASIARAVHHAHQHGVLHRDLKPTNILLDENGQPHLTDFGLAKLLAGGSSLTVTTDVLGTPSFMAPEQAAGNARNSTTASDIYSPGAILYDLLTGEPPFRGETTLEVLQKVQSDEPRPPRVLNPAVHRDLESVCLKCLEKEPARRYADAGELARDLERYLNDEPVEASAPSTFQRTRKFVRRHKLAVAAGMMIALLFLGVAGTLGWIAWDRAEQQAVAGAGITSALSEVKSLLDRDRLPEADQALKRAEGFLANGRVSDAIRGNVRQWRADLEMLTELEQLRFGEADAEELEADTDSQQNKTWAMLSYRPVSSKERANIYTVFQQYGFDLVNGNADVRVAQIQKSNVARQLLTSIDLGAIDFFSDQPDRDRLLGLTQRTSRDAWLNRARAAAIANNREALRELANDRIEEQPPESALFVARLLDASHDHATALAVARAVQARHPDHFLANRLLGVLTFLSDRSSREEIQYLRAAVALRPSNPLVRAELGGFFFNHHLFEDAIRETREAVRLNPRWVNTQLNLANMLTSNRQPAEAVQSLRAAVAASPEAVVLRLKLGAILNSGMNQQDEAIKVFETCTTTPDKEHAAKAYTLLGDALSRKGLRTEAEACFRRAIEIDPDFPTSHARLGMFLQYRGEKAAAEAEYREGVRLDPKNPSFRNWLVTFLEKEGRRDEAEAIRKEAPTR